MRVAVRSWLIRGLILAGVAVLVAVGWVANSWVSPERVRAQVIAHLHEQFEGVDVHVGSARMRILGGIAVTDLRIVRRGDPPDRPLLVVPSAVVYHDKEQLNRGRLVIRKVELENPEFYLERSADGTWNLAEVLRPGPADKPVPTFVAKGAKLVITDHTPNGLPPLTLTDARLSLMNDPLPVLTLQGQGVARGFGPFQGRIQVNRITRHTTVQLELPELPIAEAVAAAGGRIAPDLAPHLAKLACTAAVRAELTSTPEAPTWRHDIRVEVKNGRFEHPELPWPAEQVALKARCVDGRLKVEEATARLGPAQVRLSLETRSGVVSLAPERSAGERDPLARLEEQLQKLDVSIVGVPLDDALLARFGEKGAKAKRLFSPTGTVDLGYKFIREAAGWKREFELRPQSLAIVYEKFKYPVADVRGWVKRTVTHAGQDTTVIDLRGTAGGQVTFKGHISGDSPDPGINLRITGTDVPLDEKLIAALPGKYPALVRQFRATGRGDFVAEITQQPGVNLCENEFRIEVRDGTVNYVEFPYLLEKVKGLVVVRVQATDPTRPIRPGEAIRPLPEQDELILDGFTAVHGNSTIWLHGSKKLKPGSRDRLLVLHVGGNNCPVDMDLRKALAPLKLDSLWTTFDPRGSLTFAADVEVIDRAPPLANPNQDVPFDAASDLKLTFNFSGPTVTPSFFRYELTDLAGWLEYKEGLLKLGYFTGRHGETRAKLAAGEVRFYPDGVVWANLGGLEMKPFVADAAFVNALPGKLKSGMEELKLRGGAELTVKHLVVLTPPDQPGIVIPPPEPLPIGPVVGPQTSRFVPRESTQYSVLGTRYSVAGTQYPASLELPGTSPFAGTSSLTGTSPFAGTSSFTGMSPFAGMSPFTGTSSFTRSSSLAGTFSLTRSSSLAPHLALRPPVPSPRPTAGNPAQSPVLNTQYSVLSTQYSPAPVARGQAPASPIPATLPPRTPPTQLPPPTAAPRAIPTQLPPPTTPPQPDPIVYWDAELTLFGASFDTGVEWEELFGSIACRGRYEGTHLGHVRGNVWFDQAVVAKQPVHGVKSHIRILPQQPDPMRPGEFLPVDVAFTDVFGTLFHGALGGEARVVLSNPVRYELWLTATNVQLDEVARHYKLGSDADLKGLAQAELHLYNRLDPKTGLLVTEGAGKIDVPSGRMYNLPILLDLVKVFKWQLPDKTAFEEAHAVFRVRGDRVLVDQLDLIGNAVCLGGSGEVDVNGDYVRFEFYTIWSKVLKQMINTPVGDLSAFLSKNLFKIRMTRENGELKYRPEPVPVVTEPMKAVAERLKNRTNRLMPK